MKTTCNFKGTFTTNHNSKYCDGIIQTTLVLVPKKFKGPTHMVEGDHHLRKRPQPSPTQF